MFVLCYVLALSQYISLTVTHKKIGAFLWLYAFNFWPEKKEEMFVEVQKFQKYQ